MPAIKKIIDHSDKPVVLTHYHFKNRHYETLQIVTNNKMPIHATLEGFICTQGAKYLEEGKLVRAHAIAITNGDGSPSDEWRLVPPEQYIYCLLIEKSSPDREICYVLVNDAGWPMVTGENPREYIAGASEYAARESYFIFGRSANN